MSDSENDGSRHRLQIDNVFVTKQTRYDMLRNREMTNLELCRILYDRMTDLQRTAHNLTIALSYTKARGKELEAPVCDTETTLARRRSLHEMFIKYVAQVETSLQDFSTRIEPLKNTFCLLIQERNIIVRDLVRSAEELRRSTLVSRDADGRTHGA